MSTQRLVLVGTYTEPIRFGTGQILEGKGLGIYALWLDATTGSLAPCGLAPNVVNPSYLAFHPSRGFVYAVNEMKEYQGEASGAISAFRLDPSTGRLTFLNRRATHGTDPCHVTVHPGGGHVFVANFASGSVCVLPIAADGSLGEAVDFHQHQGSSVDPRRQAGPHAHAVTLDATGTYAYVPDLGIDRVVIYRFDAETGRLLTGDPPAVAVRPGAGPRQIAFHPSGTYAYLINELDSTMTAFLCTGGGALEELQTLPTLPSEGYAGHTTCAEVQIAPSGRFVYGSNRGHDSIVGYRLDQQTGMMTCIGHAPSGGRTPRNFCVTPDGRFALVANQDSDNIVVFRIEPSSGSLSPTGFAADVPTPVCVKVL